MEAFIVPVIESERGWGSKIDDYMICLSYKDAEEFIKEFNSKNISTTVPNWYMQAESPITSFELTQEQFDFINKSENSKFRIWKSYLKLIK